MGKHFYFFRGRWYFHSWCGHDFGYDPVAHTITETWLYIDYMIEEGDASRTGKKVHNPLDINFETYMGANFKELLSFLSTCNP